EQAAAERAAARAARKKEAALRRAQRNSHLQEEQAALQEEEEQEEETFESLLEEEPEDDLLVAAGRAVERLKEFAGQIKARIQERREEASEPEETNGSELEDEMGQSGRGRMPEPEEKTDRAERASMSAAEEQDSHAEASDKTEKSAFKKTKRHYGAKSISEEAESVGRRILHSLHMETPEEKREDKNKSKSSRPVISSESILDDTLDIPPAPTELSADSIDLDTVQTLDRLLDHPEKQRSFTASVAGQPESTQTESDQPVSTRPVSELPETEQPAPVQAKSEQPAPAQPVSELPETEQPAPTQPVSENQSVSAPAEADRLSKLKVKPHLPDVKAYLRKMLAKLREKGFGRQQFILLGAAGAILILIMILIACAAGSMMRQQKKKKYVTADTGLTVLVENQPEEWCSSCELELKFSAKGEEISSVEIDGVVYEPDEEGIVTVEAQEYLLEASVETGSGTLSAQIEIPMLDAEAPVLSVELSEGEITLTAADARSGVSSIWYATVDEDSWLEIPHYRQYSEPILYEEGTVYYFYASDQAGNHSSPVVTTMETAESLSLSEEELTLFPGESTYIQAEVFPSGALLNNVNYESSNTDVVTVSSSGLMTAVTTGSALVKVSADNLETVSCMVNVTTEQTITVSTIGDCTLGTYAGANTSTSFDTYYAMYGADYFFENVRDILENDDVTFANLEGTLTNETTPEDKTYAFKGDPSYTEILLSGSVEVVTLANNHSSDYGAQSLTDTKENLTDAGIDYCIGDTIAYQEISGIKIAFIGIYELSSGMDCEEQVRKTIAEAQEENARLIFVAFHWGSEKETAADETQQSLAHIAVDCGADLVVGHHPHVLQGIE
ncbi:MAG: CapA family protein, partial [Clostridiales bacterium]|nr:CapA family protein [Clostridiales bacterium]